MKIAILITGQIRDSYVNYLNHLNCFIKPNDADVFVKTSTKNFWYTSGNSNPLTYKFNLHSENSIDSIKLELDKYYGKYLKDYIISDKEYIPDNFGTPEYYAYFINNQFNNNKDAFKLAIEYEKTHNVKYDLFVRIRIDKTVFPKITKLNTNLNLPVVTHIEPCQFFFIGNKNQMQYYCDFTYLNSYKHQLGNTFSNNLFPHPPDEIKNYITKKYKINIIKHILTIYFNKNGTIGNFPYINKNLNQIGWNWKGCEPN